MIDTLHDGGGSDAVCTSEKSSSHDSLHALHISPDLASDRIRQRLTLRVLETLARLKLLKNVESWRVPKLLR